MKKLFTILAAALFSVSMMAQTTLVQWDGNESKRIGYFRCGSDKVSYSTVRIHANADDVDAVKFESTIKFTEGNTHYLVVKPTTGGFKAGNVVDLALCFSNKDDSKVAKIAVYAANKETRLYLSDPGINGRTSPADPDIVSFTLEADQDSLFLGREDAGTTTFLTTLHIYDPAPSTDPVIKASDASILAKESGVEATQDIAVVGANLTGSTLTATLSPAVDGLSVTLAENAITDGTISTTATLHYTQTENVPEGQTTLTLSDGTTSKEVTITYVSSVETWELQSISESTSWDFSKITCNTESALYNSKSNCIEFTAESTPSLDDEIVYINYADGDLWTLADGFDGTTMAFKGQYPTRNNQFCQNGVLRFNTTVAGKIVVKFSDTGSSPSKTAVKRYLVVNNQQTEYWTSRENNSETEPYAAKLNVESGEIAVSAGDVTITGSSAIVVSKVTFTKGAPTAVENAEAAVKAVKVVENGQLVIIKNGVKYNAQGAIVK